MAAPLTPRQQQCLDFLRSEQEETGALPKQIVVASALSISTSRVASLLHQLAHRGWIEYQANKRGLRDGRYARLLDPTEVRP